ncbi:MAG: hypothetical protein SPF24_01270 [Sodaliphilus sp.]|nr:hypothetical protein [Sodaliphilus sp.]
MGKNKAHNRKKEAFFEKSETPISQTKDILGYKPPQNLYFIHYFIVFQCFRLRHVSNALIDTLVFAAKHAKGMSLRYDTPMR